MIIENIEELNSEKIESLIYEIRGVKVMLDFDLARIYGYETKRFNEQVKNNIEKFPYRYRFQLDKNEIDILMRSKKSASRKNNIFEGNSGGTRYLPYVFTEQGIYMLMTVLKGELATKQSIILIDTFKQMKDYLIESNNLLSSSELLNLTNKVYTNEKNIEKIKNDNKSIKKKLETVMDNFIDPTKYKHFKILNGERIEAIIAYQTIFNLAKKSIFIIDDYIDIKTLQELKICKSNINIIIFSDNKNSKNLSKEFIEDFKKDANINIKFIKNNNIFHGRYIVIDYGTSNYLLYHSGPSIKDAGNKIDTINLIEEKNAYITLIDKILNNEELTI